MPDDRPITVHLAKSGRTIVVPANSSILDALLFEGIDVPHSCTQGVCGSCETRVLAGRPEHRDQLLSEGERAEGKVMYVCCSRAQGDDALTLDW
jgi:ferredoxin